MPIILPDARQLSDEVLEALRLRALRGCEMVLSEGQVADLLGVTRETVSRWWTVYSQQGVPALPGERTGRPQGSGRLLDEQRAAHIRQLIDNNTPLTLGIPAAL
jgi:transposase